MTAKFDHSDDSVVVVIVQAQVVEFFRMNLPKKEFQLLHWRLVTDITPKIS